MSAMSVVTEPFPWHTLPAASRVASRLAAWLGAARRPRGGLLDGLSLLRIDELGAAEVGRRLTEPSAVVVPVRRGAREAVVLVPWRLWRAAVATLLGGDDELAALRPPTLAERALVAGAVAELLARADVAGEVELGSSPLELPAPVVLVELAVTAPVPGVLAILVPVQPGMPAPPPRPLGELLGARGGRLPAVTAAVALARGAIRAWGAAAVGDVVVVGPPAAVLLVGRGAIAVVLDGARGGVTVLAPDERNTMPGDDLAHDLPIPLAIVAGDVTLSARALLELAPGQVLTLGRPLGGPVELRAGTRCLARGELVTIDGELGVRLTELVEASPAVVATSG